MAVTLAEVTKALEAFAPVGLAETWDRPGLQAGDPSALINSVVVALDPSISAVGHAARRGAQLLVTHHPLLLSPLRRLDYSDAVGRVLVGCVKNGIALYSCHTNLDRAEGGVNDALAQRLGLRSVEPFGAGEQQVKLVVTVPVGYEARVRRALTKAGAGRIGAYEECSYSGVGWGTFRPSREAAPFLGRNGVLSEVRESRLEAVVPRSRLGAAQSAVREAHPYEEPAVDVYAVEGLSSTGALGRLGSLDAARSVEALAADIAEKLEVPGVRVAGNGDAVVDKVAVCGGSGASLWVEAKEAGAQALVTGDVKYHTAREAVDAGFVLIDAGHAATEAVAVEVLSQVLAAWASRGGRGMAVEKYFEPEPLRIVAARGVK